MQFGLTKSINQVERVQKLIWLEACDARMESEL